MGWKIATVMMNLLGAVAIAVGGANYTKTSSLEIALHLIDTKVERHFGEHTSLFNDSWKAKIEDMDHRLIRLEERIHTLHQSR